MASRRSPDEKLQRARQKALELLMKSQSPRRNSGENSGNGSISYLFRPYSNNESNSSLKTTMNPRSLSINLSDLAEEKTIHMQQVPEKLTFDPKEITGRSTMCKKVQERREPPDFERISKDVSIQDILATSRCQNVRNLTKTFRESMTASRDFDATAQNSFQSEEFISSDNLKKNILSDDEREWEKEFFPVPGANFRRPNGEIPVDYEGSFGFMLPHNASTATDQFSLGAFCNKQSESLRNIIRADSPTHQSIHGVLNTTASSAASAAPSEWGKTYEKTPLDIESFISDLNLSESTNRLLQKMRKDLRKPKSNPLEDITRTDQNVQRSPQVVDDDVARIDGKENRLEEKEYREFCRFNTSKSPRRTDTVLTLSHDPVFDVRRMSTRVTEVEGATKAGQGGRKRSRSSNAGKVDAPAAVVEYPRSKSPCARLELQAISGAEKSPQSMESTLRTERILLFDSPVDSGKMSLPNYGIVKGANKSPGSAGLTRTSSQLSTASEFNHREGYLPLKSTHGELSWGSVRLRTSVTKSIQVKNTSAKRLVFRAVIDGPGFQFGNADAPQITITLQPQECRALWIVFCPTIKGPAVGGLIFKPPMVDSTVKRVVPLYGYGGHAIVTIEGLQQGPVGSKFLPMGDMKNLSRSFEQTITAYNKGSLDAFASINVDNTRTGQRCFTTSVSVSPSRVIIPPMRYVNITVTFRPQRDELKELLKMQKTNEVLLIANLIVITGDEPSRYRVKKLLKNNPNHSITSSTHLSTLFSHQFSREQTTQNIGELRENALAIVDLVQGFRSIEIALTMNNGTDDTLMDASGWVADIEETILFKTIQQEEVSTTDVDEEEEKDLARVETKEIFWESFERETRTLSIKSTSERRLLFKMDSNIPHLVEFFPAEGELLPRDSFTVLLKLTPGPRPRENLFTIRLKIDHQVIMIPVHIGTTSDRS